jgi:hypothetical protein
MGKKIAFVSLALITVLSFSACAGEDLPSSQEILSGVNEAMDDTRTYQFDMDMTMEMGGEAEGESFDADVEVDSSSTLDIENSQMKMDMTMYMAIPGEEDVDMAIEMYFIENMIYMMMDVPGMGATATWMKSEAPTGTWDEVTAEWGGLNSYLDLLELAEVEVTGSETVGGIDCYVVEITPDMEQLWQIFMQQSELTWGMPEIDEEFLDEVFRSYSVKQWIAKDTYLLAKAEIDIEMEFTPEALGFPDEEGELTMNATLTILVYDYNQPVSIELPPEAEDAVEMPMGF